MTQGSSDPKKSGICHSHLQKSQKAHGNFHIDIVKELVEITHRNYF